MEGYLQTGVGIFVSIILFLLGYRQTVGAKKERIRTANKEVEKILIRRIVNENFQLSIMDIKRLLEGKARDFKLKAEDLFFEEQILNSIYTRILETDLITQEQRNNILSKLLPIIEDMEKNIKNEESIFINISNYSRSRTKIHSYISLIIALVASISGGLFTTIPFLRNDSVKIDLNIFIMTSIISLLAISFIVILKNFKESQQDIPLSNKSQVIENVINFEREVAKVISKQNYIVFPSSNRKENYDFSFNINTNDKVLIEVKSWKKPPSAAFIERTVTRLSEAVITEGARGGIIVIPEYISFYKGKPNENIVKIMSLNEFKQFIKGNGA
ncbi:hypothetical protein N5C46_20450 [Rossellomorea vietnamensis]|uniref:Uncharacterized protein n=1 Tax=Rossellomorea vietnamensis TaxID=218284 RepID=A0ACD4C5Q6_9BACI|nr:hypothetical protein [Rossellomorea vietnamensis]UXH43980.1 hypothetical protein N5C46_20450 [Rossellomorea vietnamensis]